MILDKIKEEPFAGYIKKRYNFDTNYGFGDIINCLIDNNCVITRISISEDCDIGMNNYLGSYNLEEFMRIRDTIELSDISGFSIYLADEDIDSIHYSPHYGKITAYFKNPEKELSAFLNRTQQL